MATVFTYRFIKESNGNVIIQWLRNGQPFQRFSVQPGKDIRVSLTASGQVIIPIDNNGGIAGEASLAVPFERIDFVNSVPSSANPASPDDAVQRLGEDFFYSNSGGTGGGIESVTGDGVDNTDPLNPVISFPTPAEIGAPSGSGNSTGTNTGDQDLSGLQLKSIVVSSDITAVADGDYINVANATYGDPTPFEGAKFRVTVRNGTATVGGTGYSTAGTVILRIFHSGSWANYVYQVAGGGDSPEVLYCSTTPITFTGVASTETTIHEIPIPTNIGNGYLYIRYNIKIQTSVSAAASTSRVRIGNVGSNPFLDTLLATNAGNTVSNIDIYRHTPLIGGAAGNIKRSTPFAGNVRNDDSAIGIYLDTVNIDWTVAKSIKLSCLLNNAGNVVISDGALVVFYPEKL